MVFYHTQFPIFSSSLILFDTGLLFYWILATQPQATFKAVLMTVYMTKTLQTKCKTCCLYQIYPPPIDTLVTGMIGGANCKGASLKHLLDHPVRRQPPRRSTFRNDCK